MFRSLKSCLEHLAGFFPVRSWIRLLREVFFPAGPRPKRVNKRRLNFEFLSGGPTPAHRGPHYVHPGFEPLEI